MINNLQAFVPTLIPPYPSVAGLRVFIGPPTGPIAGTVLLGSVTVVVPSEFVNVNPLSNTYIYVNMTNAQIESNNSGFSGTVYPICIVTTNQTEVVSIFDVRPDISTVAGGGGGSSVDSVEAFTAPQSISIVAGQNIFATSIASANPLALPNPAGFMVGQTIKIIKIDDTGYVSITGAVQGISLSNQYQYVVFETDGVNWYIISNN